MEKTMRAVAYRANLPVTDPAALEDVALPVPAPGPRDLLVRVEAVSVNPVDVKLRNGADPGGEPRVLGFDAAGTVVAVGAGVERYSVGDEVYYAGDITRPGTDAEYHAVDERIVGRKPASLDWAEAAALPLTAITAYESLVDKLKVDIKTTGTLLVLAGAGGVGSALIQLAKALTGLTVIATASRPESRAWARDLGADHVVDHADLVAEVLKVAPDGVDYLFSPNTKDRIADFAAVVKPFGEVVAIDEPELDILPLKSKSITFHWELMFTRSMHKTPDMSAQRDLLDHVADLVEKGAFRTTLNSSISPITAENLRKAHEQVESGRTVGKVVLAHWPAGV